MAENSRTAKLSSKDDECVFSWKLFTGWDFMIGHSETAQNRIASGKTVGIENFAYLIDLSFNCSCAGFQRGFAGGG